MENDFSLDGSLELIQSNSTLLYDLYVNFIEVDQKEYKKLAKDLEIFYGYGHTPFGDALLAFSTKGMCFLAFGDDEEKLHSELKGTWKNAKVTKDDEKVKEYLKNILINEKKVDIFVKGTNFQVNVWKALLNIEYGCVATYQDIADCICKPKAVRAVANAIGSNNIAYFIPCHRVIAKSGAISGYRWGVDRKKILLAYEASKSE
ncbi:methylated-DNA--[protein]-cysteine S-methyltransferase [Candidatus Sulfurimonas marisnigri]|uniref:methylated-DNA--[protein]-cysteine S-methyltransferase n=1 Tax=Candidatus Sulfurimonas marisnigri TaxID=2740405 RepID=A0A7S7RPZ3_9BACT|nr:methylated-DNA--[protein]-cysteine S-methyltransferase [Candidatus Sulfurimonas marisnigri]QOY54897.1 methylated-DNA--[protein]-cysteine S-methyltransferase [Candidatus Sulfurimonas marisnigri]